jgi:S-formylglutathione hydrolase FrmB
VLSRRLLGLGAAGAVGLAVAGVVETRRHPNLLRRLGLDHSPDRTVPDFHVPTTAGQLTSRHLGRTVRWRLSLPAQPALATVFCLHGRGGNQDAPFDEQHLPDVAAQQGLRLAFAGVDGGDHGYWHARRAGGDALAMLIDELVPLIEARTGTSRRALMGWSMGGYGALLAAELHPRHFAGVAALSPALWTRAEDAARGAFDDPEDFHRHDVFAGRAGLATTPVFIACGSGDPFLANARRFAAGLPGARTDFGRGYHDPPYWRTVAPAAVAFLGGVRT